MVSGEWSVVSGQWSVVSGQWSVVSGLWCVVCGVWCVVALCLLFFARCGWFVDQRHLRALDTFSFQSSFVRSFVRSKVPKLQKFVRSKVPKVVRSFPSSKVRSKFVHSFQSSKVRSFFVFVRSKVAVCSSASCSVSVSQRSASCNVSVCASCSAVSASCSVSGQRSASSVGSLTYKDLHHKRWFARRHFRTTLYAVERSFEVSLKRPELMQEQNKVAPADCGTLAHQLTHSEAHGYGRTNVPRRNDEQAIFVFFPPPHPTLACSRICFRSSCSLSSSRTTAAELRCMRACVRPST